VIREAASVILLRSTAVGFEVLLVRRNRGASFMASAYVFPGGVAEDGEDARTAAARELFEEAGVLLAKDSQAISDTLEVPDLDRLRKRVRAGAPATAVLRLCGLQWATEAVAPWGHWITPSIEPKRYSARFFVAELPPGQEPAIDDAEAVDLLWVTPADALARAGELQLPPPQVRTCWELAEQTSIEGVFAAARDRAEEPHPILPRLAPGAQPCLLLPWDPDYVAQGTGEAMPLAYHPRWAHGPSRFVMEGRRWQHVAAPSTNAG
jgi:8-oxo-dGTP pyrophosphatase MutT (NUDIX family)